MNPFDVFTKLLKINNKAGRFITIGIMVLAGAAIVSNFGIAQDQLVIVALLVIGFAALVFVLMNIPGMAVRILGWILTICFSVWLSALLVQTLGGNRVAWLAPTQCLVFIFSENCQVTQSTRRPAPVMEPLPEPVEEVDELNIDSKRVFVQFAGSIKREDVIGFSNKLTEFGFVVEGADRGGERTGLAYGLNEVRYFHDEDRAAAELLAEEASMISPAGSKLVVQPILIEVFSGPETKGLLEIWISN